MSVLINNPAVFDRYGVPYASVDFVFPHVLTLDTVKPSEAVTYARPIAEKLAHLLIESADAREFADVLRPHVGFLNDATDDQVCSLLNSACDIANNLEPYADIIGYRHAQQVFRGIQQVTSKFGNTVTEPHYTYNDPDNYVGTRDIQFCYPTKNGDIYGCAGTNIVFVQKHPGGDARNICEGRFYTPVGIDSVTDLYGSLGAGPYDLGVLVEVPTQFNFLLRVKEEDEDLLCLIEDTPHKVTVSNTLQRILVVPTNDTLAVAIHRINNYLHKKNLWQWVGLQGHEQASFVTWGVSATPHVPYIVDYSESGYFKWLDQ